MKLEITGTILSIRTVEDTIRATRKYTKGAFTKKREYLIQGEEFASRVLTEYYEVYPDIEVSWDMPARDAWAWVWGDVLHIDVFFHYDYKRNIGRLSLPDGDMARKALIRGIPGFQKAFVEAIANEPVRRDYATQETKQMVGNSNRAGTGSPAYPQPMANTVPNK